MLFLLLLHILLCAQTPHSQNTNSLIDLGSSISPAVGKNSWQSPSGLFAFGFYREGRGFAVGIWLSGSDGVTEDIVVWTANRDDAPVSSSATINFTTDGKLVVYEHGEVKAIAEMPEAVTAASASMLDSGSFVLYDNQSKVIWESFNHPTDTMLGGQRMNAETALVSSASASNHSSGRFTLVMQGDDNLVAYNINRSAYWMSNTHTDSAERLGLFLYLNPDSGALVLRYANFNRSIIFPGISQRPDNNSKVIYRAMLRPDSNLVLYSHSFYADDCYPGFLDEGACQGKDSELSYSMTEIENINWGGNPYAMIRASKENCNQTCLEDCNCWGTLFSGGSCSKYKLPLIPATLDTQDQITAFVKSPFPANFSTPSDQKIVVERKKALVLVIGMSLGSFAVLCSFLAIIGFLLYWHRARADRYQVLHGTAHHALNGEFALRFFSYAELEKATNGFKEILGTSSFGAVYKGTLSEFNKCIAVKNLENVAEGETKFRAEMMAVGQTHHRNLVQLLGFCIEGSRKLLVYEFMKYGSLADYLFKMEVRPHWNERVRIALDVARGILYLHEECESTIIHCNIKPQNILLNDAWTAKISEFGLAKLVMTNQSGASTGVKRTSGYMPPEWQKTSLITEKADIYSFGVVLLEIICCRSMELNVPTTDDNIPVADGALRFQWVYNCFSTNNLKNLVGDEEVDVKVLERMVKVGLLCIQEDPNLRPAMKNVILMLEGTMDMPDPQF
ncbi:hypothetical protein C2S53_017662 [Perilla frutescens var. hirtella]|uniref:Receptor-like serine/threonine-protein kinase n=1 Tax=Perilla frutescens var. hirtella TaxID=608512 RepID=A0AAD4P494_PERFH|nr:hypothetical protein C2S53_017662 [Perilla frutescens var. hirtella]